MSHAYLPIGIPNKSRKSSTASDHLRWLEWLLKFHSLDLSRLTTNQRYGLCGNIVRFYSSYPFSLPIEGGIVERGSISSLQRELKRIQKQLREGLHSLLVGEEYALEDPKGILALGDKDQSQWETLIPHIWHLGVKSLALNLWRFPEYKLPRGGNPRRYRSGAIEYFLQTGWPDIFWVAVADLLRVCGDRVRKCQKKECGKVFIKTKRQDYCSPQCSQSTRTQKWYAKNQTEARRKRRDSYEKTKKLQLGPNTIIHHRAKQ